MRSAVATRILKKRDKSMGLILKEKILKYYNKLIGEDTFHRFEFYAGMNTGCRYLCIVLIPSISIDVNNQMNSTWRTQDGILYESEVGISMEFRWIVFYISFGVNFKTNKPEVKED